MKKLVTFLAVALVSVAVFAQAPQKMSYQAVVRNSSNALVVSTPIAMRISILQYTSSGSAVYVETHTPTTNVNGVATLEIGAGSVSQGNFSTINWANGPYFIKIETDLLGGTNYSISGTSQLLSVPYALYAEKSGNSWLIGGNTLTTVGQNFLGTIDAQPLMFKVNSTESGYIDWDNIKANTGFGFQTLISNTSGRYNTANGYNALQSNTTGINNSAFGSGALQLNTTAMGNTATGYSALNQNVSGTGNTANGAQALQKNTSGVNNTAIGYSALINNTTGGNNSAIGLNALQANLGGAWNTATGEGALLYSTTGNYNTGLGVGALFLNTTGSYNTALGKDASVSTGNLTNATALGYNARVAGSNNLILGNNDVNVGIGLSDLIPGNKLEINAAPATNASGLRFRQLTTTATPVTNPGTGVLTVDASGDVIYVTEAAGGEGSNDWKLAGNVLSTDNTYFIGTIDNFPLDFRVNSTNAGSIDPILFNTFFGYETGNAVPTGKWNTAIGNIALKNNTTGQDNTAIGDKALTSNTTGKSNTANGKEALYTNTTGDNNTANGFQALYSNTTGSPNTATGFSALYSNTTGIYNSAFGPYSLYSNTTGSYNSAFGASLVMNTTGSSNSAFGDASLSQNKTGSSNSAFGDHSLTNNITGVSNSAFGRAALSQNNAASGNSAFGYQSLGLNTTGYYNAAFGSSSLYENLTGQYNSAFGPSALYWNTSGDNNASFGYLSLNSNTTGSNNSAFGFKAGINLTTETNLTLIGANAGINASGYDNATAIGYNAIITGSNTIKLGDNNIIDVKTAGTYTAGAVTYPNTLGNAGDVLTLPASGGNAYWSAPSTGGSTNNWDLLGNAGTSAGLNFLGTTDLQPLMFKVNSVKSGYIDFDNTKANTFLGFQTGINNTGFSNTAMGYGAFVINVTGHQNTAFGYRSLYSNTTGNGNVANGMSSLFSNTTGSLNTATGTNALFANSTGLYNTANGNMSLANTGASDGNTALGYSSGDNNVNNGNNNTFIGNSAAANGSGFNNATALGYNTLVTASDNMILGNNDVNVGIGLSGISPGPAKKLEINAGSGESGLRFRQLTSSSTQTTNPGTGVLSVNTSGDVILVPEATGTGGSAIHVIGESYGGGIVFYVYDGGLHGLIAATTDQSSGVQWYNGTYKNTGSKADGLGAGKMNTAIIVATQIGDNETGDFAAMICADYLVSGIDNVYYGDWYLPSQIELSYLYEQRNTVGAFTSNIYWSSTGQLAPGNYYAFAKDFVSGGGVGANKSSAYGVRAIRSF